MKNHNDINELVHSISCDLPEDMEINSDNCCFEVWATGLRGDQIVFDTEMLLETFNDPEDAVKYVENLTLADIIQKASDEDTGFYTDSKVDSIQVEIETVVDFDDIIALNVGSLKTISFQVNEQIESAPFSETVVLTAFDYELLDDGVLKVVGDKMQGFSTGDYVICKFVDEGGGKLTYKVLHNVVFDDELWTYCEFIC